MYWRVVHAHADSVLREVLQKLVTILSAFLLVQNDGVQVPRMPFAWLIAGWEVNRKARERFLVLVPYRVSPLPGPFEAFQLMNPQSGLDVSHVVLVSRLRYAVMPVTAVAKPLVGMQVHAVQGEHAGSINIVSRLTSTNTGLAPA